MLSLGGIPPIAGFIGKFYVFSAAIKSRATYVPRDHRRAEQRDLGLLLPAGVDAMYMTPGAEEHGRPARQPYLLTSIVLSAVMTVLVGVFPAIWMQLARLGFLSL